MKQNYTKAEMTLVLMDVEDIVATSVSLANFDIEQQDKGALGDLLS